MNSRAVLIGGLCLAISTPSFADFRYSETTKVTGGSIMQMTKSLGAFSKQARQIGDPVTSTVYIKGNRMAHVYPDRTEIIDLDNETITHIDHEKKQYNVVTFQQIKEQMEKAAQDARKCTKQPDQDAPEVHFNAKVRNTGATKVYSGLKTKESILNMTIDSKDQKTNQPGGMAMTNDMWMAPEIPGYSEAKDFQRRFAIKMGTMMGDSTATMLGAMQPGSAKGFAEMAKEMSKLQGVPVFQVMRMGSTVNGEPLPAASEAPLPTPSEKESPSAGQVAGNTAKDSATSAVASKMGLGGLMGGLGRKKKQDDAPKADEPKPDANNAATQKQTASVLMESQIEMSGFSSAPVDPSSFNIPSGYKRVEGTKR